MTTEESYFRTQFCDERKGGRGERGEEGMNWRMCLPHSNIYFCSKERWETGESSLIKISIQTGETKPQRAKNTPQFVNHAVLFNGVHGRIF